jgi:hypothetical protein
MRQGSLEGKTKVRLQALSGTAVEFKAVQRRKIAHDATLASGAASTYQDISAAPSDLFDNGANPPQTGHAYIERYVWSLKRMKDGRKLLMNAAQDALKDTDEDGFDELVDAWDNPLTYAVQVNHTDGVAEDDFLPRHKHPFFASAGADGKWGNAESDPEATVRDDNLYSFSFEGRSHR